MKYLYIPAIPVAQPRQQHRKVDPKQIEGEKQKPGFIQNYTPTKHPVNAYKATVRQVYIDKFEGSNPIESEVFLFCQFCFPRPSAKVWKRKPMTEEWKPGCRNDFDNLLKSTCDALNGLAWKDDGLIVAGSWMKCMIDGNGSPHVKILFGEAHMTPSEFYGAQWWVQWDDIRAKMHANNDGQLDFGW